MWQGSPVSPSARLLDCHRYTSRFSGSPCRCWFRCCGEVPEGPFGILVIFVGYVSVWGHRGGEWRLMPQLQCQLQGLWAQTLVLFHAQHIALKLLAPFSLCWLIRKLECSLGFTLILEEYIYQSMRLLLEDPMTYAIVIPANIELQRWLDYMKQPTVVMPVIVTEI